jgi:hypothetical protein
MWKIINIQNIHYMYWVVSLLCGREVSILYPVSPDLLSSPFLSSFFTFSPSQFPFSWYLLSSPFSPSSPLLWFILMGNYRFWFIDSLVLWANSVAMLTAWYGSNICIYYILRTSICKKIKMFKKHLCIVCTWIQDNP